MKNEWIDWKEYDIMYIGLFVLFCFTFLHYVNITDISNCELHKSYVFTTDKIEYDNIYCINPKIYQYDDTEMREMYCQFVALTNKQHFCKECGTDE